MERPDRTPDGIDIDKASIARVYDYLLGGSHNFAVDRDLARKLLVAMPDVGTQATANRAFLRRAVRVLLGLGVRQFLDVGSGIPTRGNVHEIAQRIAPETRVVYVDNDPIAVAHSRQILAGNERADMIHADVRHPRQILDSPVARKLIDPDQPVGVLMCLLLHAVADEDDPHGIVAALRDWSPAGSYLVLSHMADETKPDQAEAVAEVTTTSTTPVNARTRDEIARFFEGYEMIDPGLVWVQAWRPEELAAPFSADSHSAILAGAGKLL